MNKSAALASPVKSPPLNDCFLLLLLLNFRYALLISALCYIILNLIKIYLNIKKAAYEAAFELFLRGLTFAQNNDCLANSIPYTSSYSLSVRY